MKLNLILFIGGDRHNYNYFCEGQFLAQEECKHIRSVRAIRGLRNCEFVLFSGALRWHTETANILHYCETHNITEIDENDYA